MQGVRSTTGARAFAVKVWWINMKKIILSILFLIVCAALSGCGSVNFAPGKAYMDGDPSVTIS